MASAVARTVFFLETPRGRRFCVATGPADAPLGAALYFPPFAEEMNKSRRMAALAAQALAARGWLVLQPDPGGCGDSEGDFGDASWSGWIEDMESAWRWLIGRAPGRRLLWTLRAGSLLAAAWLRESEHRPDLLLWQPVFDGGQHLNQFLRLELMRSLLAETGAHTAMASLRARLDNGERVEIAGYTLAPELAKGLAAARLAIPAGYTGRIDMIELGREAGPPSPALAARREAFAASGARADACKIAGAAFWQTQEITEVPALIEKTLAVLGDARP
ncbi:MAG: hydrolase 2, exosortase A system-associated [Azoarcus sp.]|nr:hydrolase 2, exosortase A system-associated [Azoarcus sp.]